MKSIEICFRTTNCYGLSCIDSMHKAELKRFRTTNCYGLSMKQCCLRTVLLSFRTTNCYGLSSTKRKRIHISTIVSVQRIVMVYQDVTILKAPKTLFPYNELLWFIFSIITIYIGEIERFRTTNCYGLSGII